MPINDHAGSAPALPRQSCEKLKRTVSDSGSPTTPSVSRSSASTERNSPSPPSERSAAALPECDVERPGAIIDEHRAEGAGAGSDEEWAQPQVRAESKEPLPVEAGGMRACLEDLVRDEQVAASALCYPKFFERTPSASSSSLRTLSIASGNVLADAELDHCEMFSIPSSDVEVGAYIGMGACCNVMRGAWRGRSVAIKTIKTCDSTGADNTSDNNSKSSDVVKEISLMCRAFATVSHPNIVGFYGICVDGPQPWLIMEYVGGGSVEDLLASKDSGYKPSRRRSLTWALDLSRGLDYLHSQRPAIVHRDIKPANLILTACREHLKLCDFGVSTTLMLSPCKKSRRVAHDNEDNICDRESAGHLTDASYNGNAIALSAGPKEMTTRTGTYRYMAPEVFEDQTPNYNSAVDIYSAALSIWVFFHGVRPFNNLDGLTVAELASRQTLRPPLHSMRSTGAMSLGQNVSFGHKKAIPSSVAQLLEGAWHGNPAQRPCASDMMAVLEEALRKEGTGVLSSISSVMTGNFFGRSLSVSSGLPSTAEFDRTPSAVELLMQRRNDFPFSQSPPSSLIPSYEDLGHLPSRSSSA
jgi:serine/threonine protein kinase